MIERLRASMRKSLGLNDFREDVAFTENLELLAVDLDVGAGILSVNDFVVDRNGHFGAVTAVKETTGANGDNDAALRLLFRAVGKKNPTGSFLFRLKRLNDNTIFQRFEVQIFLTDIVKSFQYCEFSFYFWSACANAAQPRLRSG